MSTATEMAYGVRTSQTVSTILYSLRGDCATCTHRFGSGWIRLCPPVGETRMSGPQADPVRFGRGDILTFSPLGTASSGTLYLRASRSGEQYAVRVLGVTGRVRVLRFESAAGTWIER